MGGGATMRAVSKVAGFAGGVVPGGIRGAAASVAPPAEHAVRKSSIPASAVLSSSSSSSRRGADVAAIQRPAWEIDGWEFAGGVEDDLVVAAGEPMPRVVFAGVPNFDEAKEATLELKDALDKVYLSSATSSESRELVASDQLSGLSLISKSNSENNFGLAVESNGTLSVPNHAIRAFKLLSTSTEAQNVVASIASDPNVWKAVMGNSVLQDFMQSNQNNFEFQEPLVPEKSEDSSEKPEARESGNNWFAGMFKNIKLSTVNLVTFLSGKFHEIFGHSDIVDGDEKAGSKDRTFEIGTSFIGLVTLVVVVVLLKRI